MNDSILFLAFVTIFGVAMLLLGWFLHRPDAEAERVNRRIAYYGSDPMNRPFLDGR